MAWEWVAPVATAVVGLAGMTGTIAVAHIGRKHAEHISKENFENAIRAKRIEKQEEFLIGAVHFMNTFTMTLREAAGSFEEFLEATPTEKEIMAMRANVAIYGSDELAAIVLRWLDELVVLWPLWRDKAKGEEFDVDEFRARKAKLVGLFNEFANEARRLIAPGKLSTL